MQGKETLRFQCASAKLLTHFNHLQQLHQRPYLGNFNELQQNLQRNANKKYVA